MKTRGACALLVVCLTAGCAGNGSGDAGAGGTGSGGAGSGGVAGVGGAAGMNGSAVGGRGGSPGIGGGAGGSHDAGATDGPSPDGARPDTGGATADRAADAGNARDAGAVADARADAGRDGATAYSPCPTNGSPCVVMPLGDSITDGFPYENGAYRVELFHQAVQGSTPITFVGRNTNGPQTVDGMPFPRGHEGYSGFTIDSDATHSGISPLVDAAISTFHPHIVLLHIGTNDIDGNVNVANAPTRLGALIDRIINDAPNTLLVVAQIIPTTNDPLNPRISAYNAAIPGLVQQRAAAGKHVALLDMYSVFTAHADYQTALMFDELHPNTTGYATMGDAWYAAVKAVLPVH